MKRSITLLLLSLLIAYTAAAQTVPQAPAVKDSELKFVVYVSRHGVRSPTGKPEQYNPYSKDKWPAWDVAPGYLTGHGYRLMELFGVYDRVELASQGLLNAKGCADAAHVTIYADSDQRTRETGRALSAGLFPGCNLQVQARSEGVGDPLFHSLSAGVGEPDHQLAASAIAGRIGDRPENLTDAYRAKLTEFDTLLATCGKSSSSLEAKRISLFDIPAKLAPGSGDHAAELKGPLGTASTLTENILLEYAEGMDASSVAWGCVDGAKLRSLIDLHTAASDFAQRTKPIARMQASNLLDHVRRALQQAATGKPVAGSPSALADVALFLVGHDTNLSNLAGLLDLTWVADGRRDDTPPGGVLIFELWKAHSAESYSVRVYFSAQTLEQMRSASPLTLENPPQRIPLFVPGCSAQDFACRWPVFLKTVSQITDESYVAAQ
jgi:4-phytase/acid phosphatase